MLNVTFKEENFGQENFGKSLIIRRISYLQNFVLYGSVFMSNNVM